MPCYHPITAYRSPRCRDLKSGKPKIFFKEYRVKQWPGYESLQVPCGQCIGCRLERSRQWAMRCVHESSLYEDNCFITLTYDDRYLPPDQSLVLEDFQKFMKRLRKKFGAKIRFFHCGEYGVVCKVCRKSEMFCVCGRGKFVPSLGRPHYHACLFNFDFSDRVFYKENNGVRLYISETLQNLWPFGFSTIGDVTFESAAYVARYVTKKITGDKADAHYEGKSPEYITMSRRPGLARDWYHKFKADVFPCDNVVLRGKVLTPPKFYDRCLEADSPEALAIIKEKRKAKALLNKDDNTSERLATKERVKRSQFNQLKRGYENET